MRPTPRRLQLLQTHATPRFLSFPARRLCFLPANTTTNPPPNRAQGEKKDFPELISHRPQSISSPERRRRRRRRRRDHRGFFGSPHSLAGGGGMAPLSWRHHTLLQALLSRGPLTEPDFHAVFAAVSGKNPATHQQLFNDTLLKINKDLAYLQFELRACINQYDGTVYYGVVNNIADDESKLGTKYSVPQIAFYKGLLEAIVHEAGNDGSITNIDALNVRLENQVVIADADSSQDSQSRLPTSIKNFTLTQKEKTLTELIRDRWLSYTSSGNIGLGIRSFLDLRSWFRGNDIPSCEVCNEACIKASTCPNEGCNVRIHEYCLKKKFSQRKASRACPGCGTEWPRQEGEVDGNDDLNEPGEDEAPSANRSSRKRRKGVKAELVEENENAGPSTAAVPRRGLRKTKAEAVEAADEASSAGASQPTRTSKRRR